MRLFAAVEPPAEVRGAVAERVAAERGGFPPASWVRAENLHLTLAFFGAVDAARVEALGAALARGAAGSGELELHLAGAGAFPPAGPVRVVWLGVEPSAPLARLAARLRDAAAEAGVGSDEKPFTSHLTLARCRRPWPGSRRRHLDRLRPDGALEFSVGAASLVVSELAPGGSRYRQLSRLDLGAAA